MTELTLAEQAETAGFTVFKLGAAGSFLGLVVSVALSSGDAGWEPMQIWFTYSFAVTIAGALIGSLGGVCRSKTQRARASGIDIARPIPAMAVEFVDHAPTRKQRPAVSAFRAAPKAAMR